MHDPLFIRDEPSGNVGIYGASCFRVTHNPMANHQDHETMFATHCTSLAVEAIPDNPEIMDLSGTRDCYFTLIRIWCWFVLLWLWI